MLNSVNIAGRMAGDPKAKEAASGVLRCTFTLACERDRPRPDGTRPVDWIDCVIFGKGAQFVRDTFRTGDELSVKGALRSLTRTDRDGTRRMKWEVECEHVYFGRKKSRNEIVP